MTMEALAPPTVSVNLVPIVPIVVHVQSPTAMDFLLDQLDGVQQTIITTVQPIGVVAKCALEPKKFV